jgi:hypothetical protein
MVKTDRNIKNSGKLTKWQHVQKFHQNKSAATIIRLKNQIDGGAERGIQKSRDHIFLFQNLLPLIERHLSVMRFTTGFLSTFISRAFPISTSLSTV